MTQRSYTLEQRRRNQVSIALTTAGLLTLTFVSGSMALLVATGGNAVT